MQRCILNATVFIALLPAVAALAQEANPAESSWADLTEDASRQALFEKIANASRTEESLQPPNVTGTSFALPKDFVFPDDAKRDKILNKVRENVIFGIDISHYTGKNLDLDSLILQKVDFVYTKATQGVQYKDPTFGFYWNELTKANRPLRGAYHFLTADDDGKQQAERFVQYVNLHGGFKKGDMPPCLDLEWDVTPSVQDRWKGQPPDKILASVTAWLQRTKELTGRTPVVYTARAWWLERGIPESKFALLKEYPIWIADYSRSHKAVEKPAIINASPQTLWQFADDSILRAGYGGGLDANIFYGSRDEFNKVFDLSK